MSDPLYDKEDVHDREIVPLMDKVIAICVEHGIPMAATFVYRMDTPTHQRVCSSAILPTDWPPSIATVVAKLLEGARLPLVNGPGPVGEA